MALERQSLVVDGGVGGGGGGGDDGANKTARLPRWTRQEILVLIQGKKVAESRVRGRTSSSAFGSSSSSSLSSSVIEPKWAFVSSYCKRHGVNRGPVQCRKRWSNLAGDFKKIKEWETNNTDESDSFWVMRNDLRRERKLPGFYDREVYDTLDASTRIPPLGDAAAGGGGGGGGGEDTPSSSSIGLSLALVSATTPTPIPTTAHDDADDVADADEDEYADADADVDVDIKPTLAYAAKAVAAAAIDVLSTPPIRSIPPASAAPISGQPSYPSPSPNKGKGNAIPPSSNPQVGSASQPPPPHHEGRKRKRLSADDDDIKEAATLQDHLIQVVEKNGMMLNAQLEAHNRNLELDRQQRNEHTSSLVVVLNKLADALGKIVEKL